MLDRTRLGLKYAQSHLSSVAAVAAAAVLALSSTGCGVLIDGTHDMTMKFLVKPVNGTFFGWTEVTLDQDINSVTSGVLDGVTLQVSSPTSVPDLTFLQTLTGSAVTPSARTDVVTQTGFPEGQQVVPLQLVYYGDLHPLFKDDHTIHIDWTGNIDPSFTAWPADGIWVQGDVQVDLQN